jgi:hypothetical protein
MTRTVSVPAGVGPAVYAHALADVRFLREHGTYQPKAELMPPTKDDRRLRETGTSVAVTT